MNRTEIVIVVSIFLGSAVIGYIASACGATPVESIFIGIGCAILGYVFELRFMKLADLSGRTLLSHYRTIEQRILSALRLAVESESVSVAIHDNVVKPTVDGFVEPRLLEKDHFAESLLISTLQELGDQLRHSDDRGLPVKHYLKTLYDLTKDSKHIRATSLLPPTLWLKDSAIRNYLQCQVELRKSKSLLSCKRVFILQEKFFKKSDWDEVVALHVDIALSKLVKPSISDDLLMDFFIFDSRGVLVSQSLRNLIIGNDIKDVAEMEKRWTACEPYVNAYYLFSPAVVRQYIEKFEELEHTAI